MPRCVAQALGGAGPRAWPIRVGICLLLLLSACAGAHEPDPKPRRQTEAKRKRFAERPRAKAKPPNPETLAQLARRVGAKPQPIELFCRDRRCKKHALSRFFRKLKRVGNWKRGRARVLHLGDSHIAADYITRTAREELQARFGDAGRGFVVVDQPRAYGGRRVSKAGFKRDKMAETGQRGEPFGFAGMADTSIRAKATLEYSLKPEDDAVVVYYHASPKGGRFKVYMNKKLLGAVSTARKKPRAKGKRFQLPLPPAGFADTPRELRIVALDPDVRIFGISFEAKGPGLIYDSVGPVGADATSWYGMERKSLMRHVRDLGPDLIVLAVGGNDALAVRQGRRSLAEVKRDHRALLRRLRKAAPRATCLVWAPMDAGARTARGIASKSHLKQVRDIQRKVAKQSGCAFWDAWSAMGGEGSFGRWYRAGIMNSDMVHPRAKGGDLIGHLFATALLNSYKRPGR